MKKKYRVTVSYGNRFGQKMHFFYSTKKKAKKSFYLLSAIGSRKNKISIKRIK